MILNPFGGPGGWDKALETWPDLHAQTIGIEWDRWACATRAAAGHRTIRADVGDFDLGRIIDLDVEGLILSPPCQTFSRAGGGAGLQVLEDLIAHAHLGAMLYTDDPRTGLVLEPLRWAQALRPRWIALEQVPDVLPIWRAIAHRLERLGYATWTGKLNAANYGVPQTRTRALLLASLDHQPTRPPPTHEKHPHGLFSLTPWPTMADVLGWPPDAVLNTLTNSSTVSAGQRSADGETWRETTKPYRRTVDRPAPTVLGNSGRWRLETVEPWTPVGNGTGAEDPAWPLHRPATTVAGRPMVAHPGATANRFNGSTMTRNDGYAITIEEGLILQDFPPDYPVQGSKSHVWEQIGNAIPVGLARAALAQLTRRPPP